MNELIALLICFALACVGTGVWLVWTYRRDRAREQARLIDAVSAPVREELLAEAAAREARRAQFTAALRMAQAELTNADDDTNHRGNP